MCHTQINRHASWSLLFLYHSSSFSSLIWFCSWYFASYISALNHPSCTWADFYINFLLPWGSYLSWCYIAVSIILNTLKNPLPHATCPQDVSSYSLPISSPQSLLRCFSLPGRCAASSSPQRGLTLIPLYYWLSWHQLGLQTVRAPCGPPSRLSAHLQCLTQPPRCLCWALRKATWPATCLLLLGRGGPQRWPPCWKEVQKLAVRPLCLTSVLYGGLVLWQRVRAAAQDRRGWVSALGVGEKRFLALPGSPIKLRSVMTL